MTTEKNPRLGCQVRLCIYFNSHRKIGDPPVCFRLQGLSTAGPENVTTIKKVEQESKNCKVRRLKKRRENNGKRRKTRN